MKIKEKNMEQNQTNSSKISTEIITIGEWIVIYLLMLIPFANIILLFTWAFGTKEKQSKSNWAKATLIWFGISFALTLFLIVIE